MKRSKRLKEDEGEEVDDRSSNEDGGKKKQLEDPLEGGEGEGAVGGKYLEESGHQKNNEGGEVSRGNDDEENFENPVNPMYIPHIAESIMTQLVGYMGHCESSACSPGKCLRGLMNARLVCKTWNDVGLRIFRLRYDTLVFGEFDVSDNKKITDFLKDMECTKDIPYQKYRFEPAFFIQKNEHLFKNFLYSFGSSVVYLKLWFDNDCAMRFPKRSFTDLRLDSLKYLFFGCVNYKGRTSSENLELTYLLEAILPSASNLKQFCFSFPPKDLKSQHTIITRFGDIVSSKLPSSVNNLKLEMKLSSDQLDSLAQLGLRLETFHCDFRGSVLERNVLRNMFESVKNTLQEMRLLDSELKYSFKLEFPCFKKLSVLEIQGGEVQPFQFKSTFPALERLILYGWTNVDTLKTFLNTTTPCTTLASLEFPYKICDPHLVYLAAKCFPNVTHLEVSPINGGAEAIEQVFLFMTGLKELDITFPFIIEERWDVDSLFTGISQAEFQNLHDNWETECIEMTVVRSRPSIVNLKRLEKLTIQDHSDEIHLTDITVQFGFLQLESLKALEIGKFSISDKLFERLGERFQLTRSYDSDSDTDSSTGSSVAEVNENMADEMDLD